MQIIFYYQNNKLCRFEGGMCSLLRWNYLLHPWEATPASTGGLRNVSVEENCTVLYNEEYFHSCLHLLDICACVFQQKGLAFSNETVCLRVFMFSTAYMTAVVTSHRLWKDNELKNAHLCHLSPLPSPRGTGLDGKVLQRQPSGPVPPTAWEFYLPGIPSAQGHLQCRPWNPSFLW